MSNYINEALLDASPYKKQADESKHLVSKWDKTGLLDGLNEDLKKVEWLQCLKTKQDS